VGAQAQIRADEVVRSMAAAAAAVRLYPPTSEIPTQAVARFVSITKSLTSQLGPVRFVVEPKAFKWGDEVIGENQAYVVALAESLYAHQIGQLIVAPGVDAEEAVAFLRCVGSDPAATREEGGLRAVAVASGVSHLAVIELTLRASTEEGLAGLDLTSAPLDAIGPAVVKSAADWARSAASGEGSDELAETIGGLEAATREMATERIAQALLQLDEKTRAAVLAAALRQDSAGKTMEGMLAVIAGMKPATLARLLTLSAGRTGTDPQSLLPKLELPPEAMRAIELMLRPSPRTESDCGVPSSPDTGGMAAEAMAENEEDDLAIRQAVASVDRHAAATRALSTTLALARRADDPETLAALGDAAAKGLAVGAFPMVREALRLLDEVAPGPEIDVVLTRARQAIAQPEALAEGLARLFEVPQARDAGFIVANAGPPGADALLAELIGATDSRRPALVETARVAPEHVVSAAGRRLRTAGPAEAKTLVALLSDLGDRRAVGALAQALDSGSPEVRTAAIAGLATLDTADAWSSIVSCLTHPDESTARFALSAIRSAGRRQAVPAMLAVLQLKSSGSRNQSLKREIISDMAALGATEALPTLKRMASRRIVFGRGNRELRDVARSAVTDLEKSGSGE
jgi:hypothetical protein